MKQRQTYWMWEQTGHFRGKPFTSAKPYWTLHIKQKGLCFFSVFWPVTLALLMEKGIVTIGWLQMPLNVI